MADGLLRAFHSLLEADYHAYGVKQGKGSIFLTTMRLSGMYYTL
jgi:hypothetical protein